MFFIHFRKKYLNFAFCILHSAFERQLVKLQFIGMNWRLIRILYIKYC